MDGKSQTIRAKQADKESSIGRVYRKELSFTDIKVVNLMYNCARKYICMFLFLRNWIVLIKIHKQFAAESTAVSGSILE